MPTTKKPTTKWAKLHARFRKNTFRKPRRKYYYKNGRRYSSHPYNSDSPHPGSLMNPNPANYIQQIRQPAIPPDVVTKSDLTKALADFGTRQRIERANSIAQDMEVEKPTPKQALQIKKKISRDEKVNEGLRLKTRDAAQRPFEHKSDVVPFDDDVSSGIDDITAGMNQMQIGVTPPANQTTGRNRPAQAEAQLKRPEAPTPMDQSNDPATGEVTPHEATLGHTTQPTAMDHEPTLNGILGTPALPPVNSQTEPETVTLPTTEAIQSHIVGDLTVKPEVKPVVVAPVKAETPIPPHVPKNLAELHQDLAKLSPAEAQAELAAYGLKQAHSPSDSHHLGGGMLPHPGDSYADMMEPPTSTESKTKVTEPPFAAGSKPDLKAKKSKKGKSVAPPPPDAKPNADIIVANQGKAKFDLPVAPLTPVEVAPGHTVSFPVPGQGPRGIKKRTNENISNIPTAAPDWITSGRRRGTKKLKPGFVEPNIQRLRETAHASQISQNFSRVQARYDSHDALQADAQDSFAQGMARTIFDDENY